MRPSAGRPELWDGSQGNKPPLSKTPSVGERGGRRFRWELRTAPQKMGRQQRTVCVCCEGGTNNRKEESSNESNHRTTMGTRRRGERDWCRGGEPGARRNIKHQHTSITKAHNSTQAKRKRTRNWNGFLIRILCFSADPRKLSS